MKDFAGSRTTYYSLAREKLRGKHPTDIEHFNGAGIDLDGRFCRISAIGYRIFWIEFRSPDLSGWPGTSGLN